jgi:hypothetical protein
MVLWTVRGIALIFDLKVYVCCVYMSPQICSLSSLEKITRNANFKDLINDFVQSLAAVNRPVTALK